MNIKKHMHLVIFVWIWWLLIEIHYFDVIQVPIWQYQDEFDYFFTGTSGIFMWMVNEMQEPKKLALFFQFYTSHNKIFVFPEMHGLA